MMEGGITGAIVAGGASSRFGGQAKGLLEVGGQRIIDRIASALRPVVETIAIVSNAPDASEWLVYALAALASILGTAFLPAESALLPALAP